MTLRTIFAPKICFCLLLGVRLLAAQSPPEPLQTLLHTWSNPAAPDSTRFQALTQVIRGVYKNQPDSALYYAEIQAEWAKTQGNKAQMGLAEDNLAHACSAKGDYEHVIEHFQQALHLMRVSGQQKKVIAGTLINLGLQYRAIGDWVQAQARVLEGLKICEEIGYKKFQAKALSNLSAIHSAKGERAEAIQYAKASLRITEEIQDPKGISGELINLGILLADEGEWEQALEYTLRGAELSKSLNELHYLANAYDNLGYIYGETGRSDQELEQYFLALDIRRKINDSYGMSFTLNLIGSVYMNREEYLKAIPYFTQALDLSQETGSITNVRTFANNLYLAYKKSGQYKASLEMHELFTQMQDSLFNEENTKTLAQQQFQYEQDKKDALAQAELARRNLQRNASLGGLGLVAILAGVLFVNGRRRRQTNELLFTQKAEIQAKSNQNELLLKEIHHRVKNNLQTISSLLYLQSAHIRDPEVREAVAAGQHRVESMALIHQKLYQRDTLAAIEMKDYLANLGGSLIETSHLNPEQVRLVLDMEELELDVDTAVPLGLIVNELITNALKYAFPGGREGTITLGLQKTGDHLELLVADDGVGTANTTTGTSFGSQLIHLLTTQLGGQMTQEMTNGYSTRIII